MELRRDIGYALGSILVAGLILALVAIGLFARMAPAIEQIRKDNVVTLDAARELLAVFVEVGGEDFEEGHRARIERSLAVMRNNLTVDDEGALVMAVTDAVALALAGNRGAATQVARSVEVLTRANIRAMEDADAEAQRLGQAGAWTAAIGGIALVLLGLFARARLERRLVRPVAELTRVLDSAKGGDDLARCRGLQGTAELERALKQVNRVLDRATLLTAKPNPSANHHAVALVALLAQREGPWAVVSVKDGLVAANDLAHERLASEGGPMAIVLARDAIARGGGDGIVMLDEQGLGLMRLFVDEGAKTVSATPNPSS